MVEQPSTWRKELKPNKDNSEMRVYWIIAMRNTFGKVIGKILEDDILFHDLEVPDELP